MTTPAWQQHARRRLAASMLLSAVLLTLLLTLLRPPEPVPIREPEFVLQLLAEVERLEPIEEFEPLAEMPAPPARFAESLQRAESQQEPAAATTREAASRDWFAISQDAAREVVAKAARESTMHPAQQEKRRRAAVLFAPSRAPIKKPIWENVEIDQMGRKVLVSGDCYRVLEDWRATYQDIQREFGQYLVHCNGNKEYLLDVDWVDVVGEKYAYIRHPDSEVPADELEQLIRSY